eukprot:scaffold116068_cov69-Phaeocystis_antarctica.AAC.1
MGPSEVCVRRLVGCGHVRRLSATNDRVRTCVVFCCDVGAVNYTVTKGIKRTACTVLAASPRGDSSPATARRCSNRSTSPEVVSCLTTRPRAALHNIAIGNGSGWFRYTRSRNHLAAPPGEFLGYHAFRISTSASLPRPPWPAWQAGLAVGERKGGCGCGEYPCGGCPCGGWSSTCRWPPLRAALTSDTCAHRSTPQARSPSRAQGPAETLWPTNGRSSASLRYFERFGAGRKRGRVSGTPAARGPRHRSGPPGYSQ